MDRVHKRVSGTLGLHTNLRVLYLVPYLNRGGTERHLIDLVRTVVWKQPPWVLAPDGPSRPVLEELATWIPVPPMSLSVRSIASWAAAFDRSVKQFRPDLIHVHAGVELLWATRRIAPECPRVFTVHGYHGRGAGLSYWLAGVLGGKLARRVIAVCRSEAAKLRTVPSDRLRVILNGVSDTRTGDPPEVPGIPSDAVVVAVASRIEQPKGVDLVVEAFLRTVQRRVPVIGKTGKPTRAHLVIMGTGSQEQALRRRVVEAGVEGYVHMVGYEPRASAYFQRADIVVQTSRQDALPLTVAEAMAAGTAVVVSDAGGLPELVQDGKSGRVVPRERVEPLAQVLSELLTNPEQRKILGHAARQRYEALFTLERFVRETLDVYRELVAADCSVD